MTFRNNVENRNPPSLYNERQVTEMSDKNVEGRIVILVRLSGQIRLIHIAANGQITLNLTATLHTFREFY